MIINFTFFLIQLHLFFLSWSKKIEKIVFFISLFCFIIPTLFSPLLAQNTGILPTPQSVLYEETAFKWDENVVLYFFPNVKDTALIHSFLSKAVCDKPVQVASHPTNSQKSICFELIKKMPIGENKEQGYLLTVTPSKITVQALTQQGLFYGAQSVGQLYRFHYRLWYDHVAVTIPCMKIIDYPQIKNRIWDNGTCRPTAHFMKQQIEMLSEWKINSIIISGETQRGWSIDEQKDIADWATRHYIKLDTTTHKSTFSIHDHGAWEGTFPLMQQYKMDISEAGIQCKKQNINDLQYTLPATGADILLHYTWHAAAWMAEISWQPTIDDIQHRWCLLDTNFNFQFFHFYNDENLISEFVGSVCKFSNISAYNYQSLWQFSPQRTLPEEELQRIKEERFSVYRTLQLVQLIMTEEVQYENSHILYTALFALNRMLADLIAQRYACALTTYQQFPTEDEKTTLHNELEEIKDYFTELRDWHKELYLREQQPAGWNAIQKKYEQLIDRQ